MKTEIYIQYGQAGSTMKTEKAAVKIDELNHHKAGLQYTASGYGHKLPTVYKAHIQGRWRRVYSRCFSNVSSEYVTINGQEVSVTIYYN